MPQVTIYDYYDINVPYDVGQDGTRLEVAIMEAREKARLYVMPCEWTAWIVDDETVQVRRRRENLRVTQNRIPHYHVLQGMHGGYMPDLNWTYRTKAEAREGAVSLAREWREEWTEDMEGKWGPVWRVTGSATEGHYDIELRDGSPTHLGYYISITECDDGDCILQLESEEGR